MEAYISTTFSLTVNGTNPECLSSIVFSDSSDLTEIFTGNIGWKNPRINLQGHKLSLQGSGEPGYIFLLGLKRSKTLLSWTLTSSQGGLSVNGEGYITNVQRSHDSGDLQGFSIEITGRLNPT